MRPDLDKISNEIEKIEKQMLEYEHLDWKYNKYALEYDKLFKDLDSKWILVWTPWKLCCWRIDKKIARKEIQLNKIQYEKRNALSKEHISISDEIKKTDAEIVKRNEKQLQLEELK